MKHSWTHISLLSILIMGFAFGATGQTAQTSPVVPVNVLAQSPADTKTDLQIICLFQSSPGNTLHGALLETNEKLHGLLDQVRKQNLFAGDLGETILIAPPAGTLTATKLLIIGLGAADSFTPGRMYLVGKIALHESNRLGVAHPFFAPTVLDGGVSKYSTGQVAEEVVRGIRNALATEALLSSQGAAQPVSVVDFTYLAGQKHAADTQRGINHALGKATSPPK